MLTAYFFIEAFRAELLAELNSKSEEILFQTEGFLAVRARAIDSVWAQQTLTNAGLIDFQSIGEAVKKLQALHKGPWMGASVSHHRRASLIAEKLRCRPQQPISFLDPKALKPKSVFCLLEQNRLLASTQAFPNFPQGVIHFEETKAAPSRAYLKLWELFTIHGFHPSGKDVCLDLGSSPGGWTWVLSQLGCRVLSVDKAPLAPELLRNRKVTSIKRDAFNLDPRQIVEEYGPVDWLFSDIICEPQRLLELVEKWRARSAIPNYVCTVKFKGSSDLKTLAQLLKLPNSRAHHLFHNKHEVTWVLRGSS